MGAQQNEDYIGRSHGHPFFVRSTRWLLPPPFFFRRVFERGEGSNRVPSDRAGSCLAALGIWACISELRVAPIISGSQDCLCSTSKRPPRARSRSSRTALVQAVALRGSHIQINRASKARQRGLHAIDATRRTELTRWLPSTPHEASARGACRAVSCLLDRAARTNRTTTPSRPARPAKRNFGSRARTRRISS